MDACHATTSANLRPASPAALLCHRGSVGHAGPATWLDELFQTLCGLKACAIEGICPQVTRAAAADCGGLTTLKSQDYAESPCIGQASGGILCGKACVQALEAIFWWPA